MKNETHAAGTGAPLLASETSPLARNNVFFFREKLKTVFSDDQSPTPSSEVSNQKTGPPPPPPFQTRTKGSDKIWINSFYNWKPVFGDKLLGIGVGRGLAGSRGG